jgi:uncharacterized membrane protein YtjA (UPF0391 family)
LIGQAASDFGGVVHPSLSGGRTMLRWALIFLVLALVAGALGAGGVAGLSMNIAYVLFVVFLVLMVISFFTGGFRGRGTRI